MPCDVCATSLSEALTSATSDVQYRDAFPHQANFAALTLSAEQGCGPCSSFREALLRALADYDGPPEFKYRPEEDDDVGFVILPLSERSDSLCGVGYRICQRFRFDLVQGVSLGTDLTFRVKAGHPGLPLRDISLEPDYGLATNWIEQCAEHYSNCVPMHDVELPTRLIDVGRPGEDLRLVEVHGKYGEFGV